METAGQSFAGGVKWAAVGVLSAAAVGGLALALFFRQPREALSRGMPPNPKESAETTAPQPVPQNTPQPTPQPARPAEPATSQSSTPLPTPNTAPTSAPTSAPKPATPGKLNINTATAAELELLPGIGPALAQRIIAHRAQHGPFGALRDLDNVRGIGPKTLKQLEPLVAFE